MHRKSICQKTDHGVALVRSIVDVPSMDSTEEAIQNGDVDKLVALVNSEVLPNVDLARITAEATATIGARPQRHN